MTLSSIDSVITKTSTMDTGPSLEEPERVKRKELTNNERLTIVGMLLGMQKSGHLSRGSIAKMARLYDVRRATVSQLWNRAKLSRLHGKPVEAEILSKKSERGRQLKWDPEAVAEATKALPCKSRQSYRALSAKLDIPLSSLHRLRQTALVRHVSAIKPMLTDEHKVMRVEYALSMRDSKNNNKTYQNLYDMVHVDEKWFWMTREREVYILAHDEEPPERTTQHKGYISKVMFLCAQARPRMIQGELWDGKIGIWPIGHMEPAKRASKNCAAGTPIWVNDSVTREMYHQYLLDKVVPAILARFPKAYLDRHGVRIQQDGAKSHIQDDDEEFHEVLDAVAPKNKSQFSLNRHSCPT
jgi:hypothetical protein